MTLFHTKFNIIHSTDWNILIYTVLSHIMYSMYITIINSDIFCYNHKNIMIYFVMKVEYITYISKQHCALYMLLHSIVI